MKTQLLKLAALLGLAFTLAACGSLRGFVYEDLPDLLDPEGAVEQPQPESETETEAPAGEVKEIPGAVYKVENGQRYQQHPSHNKWIAVDDQGNWLPISNTWLLKINAERDGKMALLIPNEHQGNIDAATINGDSGQRGSEHTNGGRSHFYYDRTPGPWQILVTFKDGSTYARNIPAGSTRSDRPGEPGAVWRDAR